MARFEINGLDELASAIGRCKEIPDYTVNYIVMAITEALKEKIVLSAQSFGRTAGAAFLNSIGIKMTGKTGFVVFKGSRTDAKHRGTREGEIAFLNEFGVASKHMASTPFIQNAVDKYGDECIEEGQKIFDNWLFKNGL